MSDNHDRFPGDNRDTLEKAGYEDEAMKKLHAQLMREKEEPTEGFSPVPIFLLFLFGALMFWGGIYLSNYSGGFQADAFNPNVKVDMSKDVPQEIFDPIRRGQTIFRNNCAQCHQASGAGVPGVYPPLAGTPWVVGKEDRLIKILLHGLVGPIEVLGNTYNGAMPAIGSMRDRDIAAVATFIRQEWGNEASPIEESQVAAVRASVGPRSVEWTAKELLEIHPMENN
jgi:mono/diheme cytochrome c family protein